MTRRRARFAACALAVCVGAALIDASPARAQRYHAFEAPAAPVLLERDANAPPAAGVFLASAVIPGAGQYRLGAGRWVAYVGVETWAWINWVDKRSEANELEQAYQDLAWEVARRISQGPRDDPQFEYYEHMAAWPASGAFDLDPATAGVQPEVDTTTYNGEQWQLAQQIFTTPEAQEAALEFYRQRAVAPAYAWSWGTNQLQREEFRTLIRRSDDAARSSTTFLGVILVNHLVSAVDALITARLREPGMKLEGLGLRTETVPTSSGLRSFLVIHLSTP